MDPRNLGKRQEPEDPRYLDFPHLPDGTMRDGKLALNKYSSTLTNGHDFPGAQVRYPLYTSSQAQQKLTNMCYLQGNALRCWGTIERGHEK